MIVSKIATNLQQIMTISAEKHESTFIERKRNVTGVNLCQTLVFGWLDDPDATLEDLSTIALRFGLNITAPGLEQRFTEKCANFLGKVLDDMVKMQVGVAVTVEVSGIYEQFSAIYVEDSSIITLPDSLSTVWQGVGGTKEASKSSVKLQVRWDLKKGGLDGPHLVHGKKHDNKAADEAPHEARKTNSLSLRDKGYWNLGRMQREDEAGQFWLYRMKNGTCIYVDGKQWHVADYLRQCNLDQLDTPILLGKSHQITSRLIAKRVPDALAEKWKRVTRRKAQKHGRTASKSSLELCNWIIIVTNAPTKKISFDEALLFVRVRWQIELLFKLWKSHGKLDKSRSAKPWRQLCEFYAKLISMILQHWLLLAATWHFPNRSLVKATKFIRRHSLNIARYLSDRTALETEIEYFIFCLSRGCRVDKSKKYPRLFQLLEVLEEDAIA